MEGNINLPTQSNYNPKTNRGGYSYKYRHGGLNKYNNPSYMNCFITNLITGKVIPINLAPDSLGETITGNFNSEEIVARSAPIVTYTNTGARTVQVSLTQTEDTLPNDYDDINKYIDALKALVYPNYSNNLVVPPSSQLVIGETLNIIGVVTNVSVNWQGPYRENKMQIAKIDLSYTETRSSCPRCHRNSNRRLDYGWS